MKLIKAICGEYSPKGGTPEHDWHFDFFEANILAVMKIVAPHARVKVMSSDDLFAHPTAKQDMLLDYVRVENEGDPDFSLQQTSGGTHYFLFRPFVLAGMRKKTKAQLEFDPRSLSILWNVLGFAVRKFLQKNRRSQIKLVPFSSLVARGVPSDPVISAMILTSSVIEGNHLEGDHKMHYMDATAIALYVSYTLTLHASKGNRITAEEVARLVQI